MSLFDVGLKLDGRGGGGEVRTEGRAFSFQAGRQDLYKKGGLVSITSQIFTVDMLSSDIPTDLITGVLILHAERCALF